ncbi:MAG: hypothetical protein ACK5MF_04155 [Vibrio sp.]|uniref:hypothetical protein n=1 Tax=Vibrio sp. TaxID=678 RepID=UPI003A85D888
MQFSLYTPKNQASGGSLKIVDIYQRIGTVSKGVKTTLSLPEKGIKFITVAKATSYSPSIPIGILDVIKVSFYQDSYTNGRSLDIESNYESSLIMIPEGANQVTFELGSNSTVASTTLNLIAYGV